MITAIEKHLIETAANKIDKADARVDCFPDNVTSYKPKHVKSDVLVQYAGSVYTPLSAGVTKRSMLFEFRVVTRGYSGKSGAIMMLEKVISAMWAYQPVIPNAQMSRLTVEKDGFVSTSEGIWQYFVRFKTDVIFSGEVSEN